MGAEITGLSFVGGQPTVDSAFLLPAPLSVVRAWT